MPRFTRIARSYLIQTGTLHWREINPDIFGSMIQAVANDEERVALGMYYTSVPNILKVLNPLFLDDLRKQLDESGDNKVKLFNLRKRMALIIAEFQCDVLYRGPKDALAEFLPLDAQNWIVCGNALRLDWLSICPSTGTGVKIIGDDLFSVLLVGRDSSRQSISAGGGMNPDLREQVAIDFDNEGGETYICGNPPYKDSQGQTNVQKTALEAVLSKRIKNWKSLDYVSGRFIKAAEYGTQTNASAAFVSTNSICQGRQVLTLWLLVHETGHEISFAHTSFK